MKASYKVKNGEITYVDFVKVERSLSVAGTRGWELSGPLGTSRLAWKDGTLLAERTANARFVSPLPLAVGSSISVQKSWKGRVETPAGYFEAEAELSQVLEPTKVGGATFQALKTRLRLWWPGNETEVLSWYGEGQGLLRQEQRTNGKLDLSMELLSTSK